jgi:methylmalonyl-CoA/ethylmalonyl-CoA epimerase
MSDTPSILGIGQIAIACHDVPRATVFYRDVVGLPFLFETTGLAFFDCGGVRLMLSRVEQPELAPPGSVLYFKTTDLEAATSALAAAGATIEQQPHLIARMSDHELWMSFWRDTEGNMMAFMQEKAPA